MDTTFPKRPRAWSIGLSTSGSLLAVPPTPHAPQKTGGHSDAQKADKMPTNIEDIDDELDEEAITADEPPPTIIEEDLFSDSEADPSKNINVPIIEGNNADVHKSDNESNTVVINSLAEPRFAEEGHPLHSIISLNTRSPMLPLPSVSPLTQRNGARNETETHLPLSLHCRICRNAVCKDITATFCGHVFCNE